jgi:gliding motility-associated protein GldL
MSQKKQSGFMHWYESYSGKRVVNMVYCLGASVVIIGALFKIMHFPGAGPVLMTGMCTEAFLFAIGCLDKPHVDFHWEQVFPQLMGYGADPELLEELSTRPKPTLLGTGGGNGGSNIPGLSDGEMNALKGGISDLAKTATQLSELGKVATSTNKLGEKMEEATEATGKFIASVSSIGQQSEALGAAYASVTTGMQGVAEGTKAYQQQVEAIGVKLGSLNSLYELQLNAAKTQSETMKTAAERMGAVSEDIQKMQTSVTEAAKNCVAYEDSAKKLASQVADLNKIYGNMLNALA